jgi:tripartite motif-containing protein 71
MNVSMGCGPIPVLKQQIMKNDKCQMINVKFCAPVLILICSFLLPARGFCEQKARVKHLTSITGNKEIGRLGLLGGAFFDEEKKRLYVTDATNHRILSFDSDFKYLSEFTGGGALAHPTSIVKDSSGKFFVAEPTKGQVLLIDMARKSIKPIDFSGVPSGNPIYPGNMAIDSADHLYLVDEANQRVLVFDPDVRFQRQILVTEGQGLRDVKVDAAGRIYTVSAIDGCIRVYDRDGNLLLKFGKRGDDKGEFDFPASLAVDEKGFIYVVDQHRNQVLVFHQEGRFLFDFSQLGWREGRLHLPSFIYVNGAGQIFVIDRENARISVFEPS